jgi:hypothetical protein
LPCQVDVVNRWDPLNARQLALLQRVAAGADLNDAADLAYRTSAYALRNRGLIATSRRGGVWRAEITDAGRFYCANGYHPDRPDTPLAGTSARHSATTPTASGSPAKAKATAADRFPAQATGARPAPWRTATIAAERRAAAVKLVETLVEDGQVTIEDPTTDEVATWRRIVDFAKRHDLVPAGKRIEKEHWTSDLTIRLLDGAHPNSRRDSATDDVPVVRVPEQLRSPHPVVKALLDDPGRVVMPKPLCRRALLLLNALAAEAARRGHHVKEEPIPERHRRGGYYYSGERGPHYSQRAGELAIGIDQFSYIITIDQESPQSADPQRSERLLLEIDRGMGTRPRRRWADRSRWKLEDVLGAVLAELASRAVADEEERIRQEEAQAARKVQWEAAMVEARRRATEAHYADALTKQANRWRQANELQAYADALEGRLAAASSEDDEGRLASAREWLVWIRAYLTRLDPLRRLPTAPPAPKLGPSDLEPFLDGWSPYGPDAHNPTWRRQ